MDVAAYLNFDLLISKARDQYHAYVIDAPGGDADIAFLLPFSPEELDSLSDLSGIRRTPVRFPPKPIDKEVDLVTLGQLLYNAVFQDKVSSVLTASFEIAHNIGAGLRLRLRFSLDASELANLPWEILYDPNHERFLGLSELSPIVRYLPLARARDPLRVNLPLRILAVLSSPSDFESLDIDREWQVMQSALAHLQKEGAFVLERLEIPTLAALQDRLLGDDVHILHFVGHGVFDESVQSGVLLLEDGQGNSRLVQAQELATILQTHSSLRLVYLNTCEGALSNSASIFTGVAQRLVHDGAPAAIAMQDVITDDAAIELARTFYTAVAKGYPIDAALTQARVALARENSSAWAIPVLFSRSPDNQLFDVRDLLPKPDCPYPGMVPFSEIQADTFFGRDKEILDATERLRQHPFLAVVGPSGSGKSSLVYAGIIPALRKTDRFGSGAWSISIMRPGASPLDVLAETLTFPRNDPLLANFEQRTLLFIDQFEEIFVLAETRDIQDFLEVLQSLVGRTNFYLILTVRADFYPDLMCSTLWPAIKANRLELTPLGDEELRAAILEPATQVGVTVDMALVERLVHGV